MTNTDMLALEMVLAFVVVPAAIGLLINAAIYFIRLMRMSQSEFIAEACADYDCKTTDNF